MSDEELLALAIRTLPDLLQGRLQKAVGRVVRCGGLPPGLPQAEGVDRDAALLSELGRMLKIDLKPSSPDDSADVEYLEQTALGTRATVVQIREGKVAKIIGQA